jgi:hypothetical protein
VGQAKERGKRPEHSKENQRVRDSEVYLTLDVVVNAVARGWFSFRRIR